MQCKLKKIYTELFWQYSKLIIQMSLTCVENNQIINEVDVHKKGTNQGFPVQFQSLVMYSD